MSQDPLNPTEDTKPDKPSHALHPAATALGFLLTIVNGLIAFVLVSILLIFEFQIGNEGAELFWTPLIATIPSLILFIRSRFESGKGVTGLASIVIFANAILILTLLGYNMQEYSSRRWSSPLYFWWPMLLPVLNILTAVLINRSIRQAESSNE
jgi:hypothetical protein